MHIGDMARASGLSVDTLRYYEKIGLLPAPLRDHGGRRVYDADALRWVEFLNRMKTIGMGIADMLAYAGLRAKGDRTSAARREMLEAHRALVKAQIAELTECIGILDGKIETYRTIEAGLAETQPTDGHKDFTADAKPLIAHNARPHRSRPALRR